MVGVNESVSESSEHPCRGSTRCDVLSLHDIRPVISLGQPLRFLERRRKRKISNRRGGHPSMNVTVSVRRLSPMGVIHPLIPRWRR